MKYKLKVLGKITDIEIDGEVSSLTNKIKVCRLSNNLKSVSAIEQIGEKLKRKFPEFKWLLLCGNDIEICELELVES